MENVIPIDYAAKAESDKKYSAVVLAVDLILDWAEKNGVEIDLNEIQKSRQG